MDKENTEYSIFKNLETFGKLIHKLNYRELGYFAALYNSPLSELFNQEDIWLHSAMPKFVVADKLNIFERYII